MQIEEFPERTKVRHRTIRYYDRLGLVKQAEGEGVGYLCYGEIQVKRREEIAALTRPIAMAR